MKLLPLTIPLLLLILRDLRVPSYPLVDLPLQLLHYRLLISFEGFDLVALRLIEPREPVLQLGPLLPRRHHLLVELPALLLLPLAPRLALGELPLRQRELLLNQRQQLLLLIRLPHALLLAQPELALEALDPDVPDLHRVLALLPPLPQLVREGHLQASSLVCQNPQTVLKDTFGAHGIGEL